MRRERRKGNNASYSQEGEHAPFILEAFTSLWQVGILGEVSGKDFYRYSLAFQVCPGVGGGVMVSDNCLAPGQRVL